jgi:hypothetical protein
VAIAARALPLVVRACPNPCKTSMPVTNCSKWGRGARTRGRAQKRTVRPRRGRARASSDGKAEDQLFRHF